MDKKLLAGAGIITAGLAAMAAVSHGVTQELVRIAIDRDCPLDITAEARKRFTGAPDHRAFWQAAEAGAARLEGRQPETVTITAEDGTHLVGHWYPCAEPRRLVVAMHGWRSTWSLSFGMIADFFHNSGCAVLYPEQRGQGRSGGDHMGLGALERYDCRDWVRWIARRVPELPIYLAGISMGATTVLMASDLALPARVKGIIADCGFTSPEAIGRHVVEKNLHLSYRLRAGTADALCRRRNRVGIRGCAAPDALRNTKIPVLLIHGADDTFVPVSMTYENYRACGGPKELLIVPGANHAMSYYVDRPRYEATLRSFWERHDRP